MRPRIAGGCKLAPVLFDQRALARDLTAKGLHLTLELEGALT